MLKEANDVFTLVMNFLGEDWMFKQISIDVFETLAKILQNFFKKYGLTQIFLFMLIMKMQIWIPWQLLWSQ
jgi:hypothetical protein